MPPVRCISSILYKNDKNALYATVAAVHCLYTTFIAQFISYKVLVKYFLNFETFPIMHFASATCKT